MDARVYQIKVTKLVDYIGYIDITRYHSKKKLHPGNEVAFKYDGKWKNCIVLEVGYKNLLVREV